MTGNEGNCSPNSEMLACDGALCVVSICMDTAAGKINIQCKRPVFAFGEELSISEISESTHLHIYFI
jgi:hypothetical protein